MKTGVPLGVRELVHIGFGSLGIRKDKTLGKSSFFRGSHTAWLLGCISTVIIIVIPHCKQQVTGDINILGFLGTGAEMLFMPWFDAASPKVIQSKDSL